MILISIYLFSAGAIMLLSLGLFYFSRLDQKRLPLPQEEGAQKNQFPDFLSGMLPFTRIILEKLKVAEKIKRKLDAGHLKITPAAFINLKLLLMAGLTAATFLFLARLEPIVLAVPVIFGYLIPDLWLNRRIMQRRQQIVFLLPETVDLLGLCVEAGLDFTASLNWIVTKVTPTNMMIEELALLLEEIKWGKGRTQALKDMAKRLTIPEVNSFVQSLVQAERMGTPVSEAFKIISEDTRGMRFQRGQRMAMKAPIKILIPLIFCILPVIAIIVAGPILLQFMQGNVLQGFTSGR